MLVHPHLLPAPKFPPAPAAATAQSHSHSAYQRKARSGVGAPWPLPSLFPGSSFGCAVGVDPERSLDSRTSRNCFAPSFSVLCSTYAHFVPFGFYQEMTIATHSQATSHGLDAQHRSQSPTSKAHSGICKAWEKLLTFVPFCKVMEYSWAPSSPEQDLTFFSIGETVHPSGHRM